MKKLPEIKGVLYDQRLYSALIEAGRAAEITAVDAARLTELANLGFAPCLWIDGKGPFFKAAEILKWTKENLVRLQAPKTLEMNLKVIVSEPAEPSTVPLPLSQMAGQLREYPWREAASAIYFLVKGSEVVYVGQSTSLGQRLATHSGSKEFDRAFYLPVPRASLNELESALIRTLRPKLNQTCSSEPTERDHETIGTFCRVGLTPGMLREVKNSRSGNIRGATDDTLRI
jgi:hypothetical protein